LVSREARSAPRRANSRNQSLAAAQAEVRQSNTNFGVIVCNSPALIAGPPHDIERHRLVGVAAETANFQV
jgi:hypothetical protein